MKIETKNFQDILTDLDACSDARVFVGDKTLEQAWQECERGDWMLWIYRRATNYDFQTLTLAKGHCANTVRHLMTDERSKKAVDTAIAFGEGRATRDELTAAADAAYAAYAHAADASAAYTAYAACAYAAADAAYAAGDASAADAAYAAGDYVAARQTARKNNQQVTADICRKYLPIPVL